MKYVLILLASIMFSCQEKKVAEEVPVAPEPVVEAKIDVADKVLIIEGSSIGNIKVGQPVDSLQIQLGVPDLSDSAMGKAWLTWFNNPSDSITGKYELNIFTKYKNRELIEKIVGQVRVTSPDFKTADGCSTGMALSDLIVKYPNIKVAATFMNLKTNNVVSLYDTRSGIAFEVEDGFCTAIIIYDKRQNLLDDYRTFRPDLRT
ncbi:MAG TPA: hypothetical protein VF581_04480 [Flavobacterium sp.]|jgi:hypothetical protein